MILDNDPYGSINDSNIGYGSMDKWGTFKNATFDYRYQKPTMGIQLIQAMHCNWAGSPVEAMPGVQFFAVFRAPVAELLQEAMIFPYFSIKTSKNHIHMKYPNFQWLVTCQKMFCQYIYIFFFWMAKLNLHYLVPFFAARPIQPYPLVI